MYNVDIDINVDGNIRCLCLIYFLGFSIFNMEFSTPSISVLSTTTTISTIMPLTTTVRAISPSSTSRSLMSSTTLSQCQPTLISGVNIHTWPLVAYVFAATTIVFCFSTIILGGLLCCICCRKHGKKVDSQKYCKL